MTKLCGLANFAELAAKHGYIGEKGGVDLISADAVIGLKGELVPKSELTASELKQIQEASKKFLDRLNLLKDTVEINK